jgi:nucleoid-associated protein EbfC
MFEALGNLGKLGQAMQQARAMAGRMQAIQEVLRGKRVTGAAGGGLVEVEANGLGEAVAVRLDPSLVAKGERELIEDLLPTAFNDAVSKARELHAQALREATGDVDVPGLSEALAKLTGQG